MLLLNYTGFFSFHFQSLLVLALYFFYSNYLNFYSFEQTNRRVLATDEWLRVEGCDNVYALGDCATVNQRRVMV